MYRFTRPHGKTPLNSTSRLWLMAPITLVLSACEQTGTQPNTSQNTQHGQKVLPTQMVVAAPKAQPTAQQQNSPNEPQVDSAQVSSAARKKETPVVVAQVAAELTSTAPVISYQSSNTSELTAQAELEPLVVAVDNQQISTSLATKGTAAELLAMPYQEADLGPSQKPTLEDTTTTIQAPHPATRLAAPDAVLEQLASSQLHQPIEPVAAPVLDLWQLTIQAYKLPAVEQTQAISRRIDFYDAKYRRQTEYMQKVTNRSSRYYHYVLNEVLAAGLPGELALLPIVESGFDTFAYSHGRAAGAWQFIPSTGRMFGLKQTWWYDGRRDVVASTAAAIKYLKQLNKMFDGDWHLAIAAYNGGPGTVGKAIKANKKLGKPTDYWSLKLPKETMHYVPKLLGLSQVVKDHAGTDKLTSVLDQPYFELVDIGSQIDLALAAELADITVDELYRLNPGFNQFATDPEGPHQLLIPLANVDDFRDKLANLPPNKRIEWQRYIIQPGDSLLLLSKRHNISVEFIRSLNNLTSNVIVAGKPLMIPTASKDAEVYSLSAAQRVIKHQQQQSQRNASNRIEHKVTSGESLWLIANKYKVSVKQIVAWNKIGTRTPLQIGQKLNVWPRVASTKLTDGARQVVKKLTYKVRNGDNLSKIAYRFNVKVKDIQRWNDDLKKYLQPGQKLTLYVDVTKSRS